MKMPCTVPGTEKVLNQHHLNLNSWRISLEPSPVKNAITLNSQVSSCGLAEADIHNQTDETRRTDDMNLSFYHVT